jgi:hypothetical protein
MRLAAMKTFATLARRGVVSDEDGDGTDDGEADGSDEDAYVVEVKRSARRASPRAGGWVNHNGRRRRFESKAGAREWAREASDARTVWVQDANPADTDPVDGYVVARRYDPERTRAREQAAVTAQTTLEGDG